MTVLDFDGIRRRCPLAFIGFAPRLFSDKAEKRVTHLFRGMATLEVASRALTGRAADYRRGSWKISCTRRRLSLHARTYAIMSSAASAVTDVTGRVLPWPSVTTFSKSAALLDCTVGDFRSRILTFMIFATAAFGVPSDDCYLAQKIKDQRSTADDQHHEKRPLTLPGPRTQQISPDDSLPARQCEFPWVKL